MNRLIWPLIILASAIGAAAAIFGMFDSPLSSLIVIWFMLICPGMAFVCLLRIHNPLIELSLAAVLSIAINTSIAEIMIYADAWSVHKGFSVIVGICLVGVLLQLFQDALGSSDRVQRGVIP